MQTSWGKSGKQQQEPISPNHVRAICGRRAPSIKSSASQFGFDSLTVDTRILTVVKNQGARPRDTIWYMVWPKVPWWWWWNKWYEMRGTHFPPLHSGVRCAQWLCGIWYGFDSPTAELLAVVMNQGARPVTLLDSVEIMRVNREAHWQSWELVQVVFRVSG